MARDRKIHVGRAIVAVVMLLVVVLPPSPAGATTFKDPLNGPCRAAGSHSLTQTNPNITHSWVLGSHVLIAGANYCAHLVHADATVNLFGTNYVYGRTTYAPGDGSGYVAYAPHPSGNAYGNPYALGSLICKTSGNCGSDIFFA